MKKYASESAASRPKTMLIIGNGPSTKELAALGFHNIPKHIHTFGMGLAFKYFKSINWWPTYYICADQKVVKANQYYFRNLVLDETNRVTRFFLPIPLVDSPRLEVLQHGSTGDFAFRKAVELGYEQIFITGIDLDYKPLKEATRLTRAEFDELGLNGNFNTDIIWRVRKPIDDHPNYFFPDYQEVGDIFSEPRGNSWHLLSWQRMRELSEAKEIPVRNIGTKSPLRLFLPAPLTEAFARSEPYSPELPSMKVSTVASWVYQSERNLVDKYLKETARLAGELEQTQSQLQLSLAPPLGGDTEELSEFAEKIAASISSARAPEKISISVIIPCHNSQAYLNICLESICRQTLPQDRFEVICIDDHSSDNTVSIINSFEKRIQNLRLIRHSENKKQGAARNSGIDASRGRYVFFLDSDDFLRLDALEVLLNAIGTADIAVCQHIKIRYDKPCKSELSSRRVPTTLRLAAMENTIGWWPFGVLISRWLLDYNRIRFREDVYFEDIDFNIRVFTNATSHSVIKEALYYYIVREGSTVNSINEKKLGDSASALAAAWKEVEIKATESEKKAFLKCCLKWIIIQAQRIRNSKNSTPEKARLAKFFVDSLFLHSALSRIDDNLGDKISEIVATPPQLESTVDIQSSPSSFIYQPWPKDYKDEFGGKVIFFCEVDYHVRAVAPIARALKVLGVDSIIIDASRSTSFTSNRPLLSDELSNYADVDLRAFNVAEALPFSTDAAAFVFMNDLTYTKRLIFENFGFGVPTFGFYEGINDDWNLDRVAPRMPYRSVDYLLLPGIYQKGFYRDRDCRIVGLPNVRRALEKPFKISKKRRAIINVNFTYGVLEDQRETFVESAVRACEEIGLDYIISQHPADKADLSKYNVSQQSVYDMLQEGSLLVSRFSTTILEALAMGRPVVYHNPIREKVPKFTQPLGAYSTSNDAESLKAALKREQGFVDGGGDIRHRASLFLHFHCNTLAEDDPSELAAKEIAKVLVNPPERFTFKCEKKDRNSFVPPPAENISQHSTLQNPPVVENMSNIMAPAALLRLHAARLLLEPTSALAELSSDSPIANHIARALTTLDEDDPAVVHFHRVRAHAEASAQSS